MSRDPSFCEASLNNSAQSKSQKAEISDASGAPVLSVRHRLVFDAIVSRLEWDGRLQMWTIKPGLPAGTITAAREILASSREVRS